MRKLEIAFYSSMICLCILSAGLLVEKRLNRSKGPPVTTTMSSLDKSVEGSRIQIPGARWGDSPTHVVLYLNSKCHFCAESSPLYREIAQLRKGRTGISLTAVSTEAPEITDRYLREQAIEVDHVVQGNLAEAGLKGTPTVLLVDSSAVIKKAFFGKLDKPREDRLLAMVGSGKF
jgi:hypothetical protein